MAHPHHEHRQHKVEKERVSHIAHGHKHRASGGRVHGDEAEDRVLFKKMMKEEHHAEGKKAKHRRDRIARAKGGRVGKHKKGGNHVNVIVGGQHPPAPMMPPPMPMGPPPVAGAAPPMPPPGIGGPPPGAGLGPLPMRARGGPIESPKKMKPYAKGGGVKSGPGWTESERTKTPVQHTMAKEPDIENMHRGRVVSFNSGGRAVSFRARGGKIESDYKVASATKLDGGSGGGLGRREKIKKYGFGKPMKEVDGAR